MEKSGEIVIMLKSKVGYFWILAFYYLVRFCKK